MKENRSRLLILHTPRRNLNTLLTIFLLTLIIHEEITKEYHDQDHNQHLTNSIFSLNIGLFEKFYQTLEGFTSVFHPEIVEDLTKLPSRFFKRCFRLLIPGPNTLSPAWLITFKYSFSKQKSLLCVFIKAWVDYLTVFSSQLMLLVVDF